MYFKKTTTQLALALVALMGSATAFADGQNVSKCVDAVATACGSGSQFQYTLERFGTDCKNLESGSKKTRYQIYELTSGDVLTVAVKTPEGQPKCRFKLFDLSREDQITKTKVESNKAFFVGAQGGAYVLRMEDGTVKFYEFVSSRGKPYRRTEGRTGMVDIKGSGHGSVTYSMSNNTTKEVDSDDIQKMIDQGSARERDYPEFSVRNVSDLIAAIVAPPPAEPKTESQLQAEKKAQADADQVVADAVEKAKAIFPEFVPPPPAQGYDYDVRDVYAPSSSWSYARTSLGDCDGDITVERRSSYQVFVSFSANKCSKTSWESIDGIDAGDARLNTDGGAPFTGTWLLTGDKYRTNNRARLVLHSNSRKTGVKIYVHF